MPRTDLQKAYDCLSAIGNTLDLESMVSEIVITFSRQTAALSGAFYENFDDKEPMVHLGSIPKFTVSKSQVQGQTFFIQENEAAKFVLIPLKQSYLLFSYEKSREDVEHVAKLFGSFQNKINISINACYGVRKLQEFNEELENRVQEGIQKIHEHEQMLMVRSKQEVMGEMIEMIAHQWRQPLTAIGMIANNIELDIILEELNPEALKKELENINKQVDYLSHTIDDFRSFFKESKEKEQVDMDELIEKTVSLVKKQLNNKGISIKIEQKCPIMLYTYKNELIQVLLNLFSNSKDAMEEKEIKGGEIVLTCKMAESFLQIDIRDNAGGINEKILPKIFEPYFSTKKEKNGTGLGLYMSRIIIEEHLKGSISATNIEGGCQFTLRLPIQEPK